MKNDKIKFNAVSLFCSGGIGDLALEENNIKVLVANEFLENRANVFSYNFPDAEMIVGDIWEKEDEIVSATKNKLNGKTLDFLFATPPCQGMSKNGQGKLLRGIRENKKPKIDERNRLIIPTVSIIKKLKPTTVLFENVPQMENTIIDDNNGDLINIIEYIKKNLEPTYTGNAEVVEFADYGVPQRRQRLITVFTKDKKLINYYKKYNTFLPPYTHGKNGGPDKKDWVSVRDMIAHLPRLDGLNEKTATSKIPYHRVPVLDPKKYVWISNTPPEKGAFDNQCINPKCLYQDNPKHGSSKNKQGINQAKKETPLFCIKCSSLLPRPYTEENGNKRIMSGYTSAYKRMSWDLPSPALTTNLCYPSSDHKIHPEQHRVLSLYEAFILHTINFYDYKWKISETTPARDTLIREIIGESIPPKGLSVIVENLINPIEHSNVQYELL